MMTPEIRDRRNQYLLDLFCSNGYSARLLGSKDQPIILIDDNWVVTGYVKNFEFIFLDKFHDGSVVERVRLKALNSIPTKQLQEILEKSKGTPIYKVFYSCTNLYLVGYDILKQPVFGKDLPKVFFSKDQAEKILIDYSNYNLKIEKGELWKLK